MDVLEELVRLRRAGRKCALATIVQANGSIPSFASAKMLVRDDGTIAGTIGGGCVEAEVWEAARAAMETGLPRRLNFSLGQDAAYDTGLICGGQLEVFVEPVEPQPRAIIFGAGHISKSLCQVAAMLGYHTTIVDDRASFASVERFPQADAVIAGEYEEVFPQLEVNGSSYLIIVTRGHRDDMRVLRWAVTTGACYIGMIGSRRKALAVAKELGREGVRPELFERVNSPMGLDIGALSPEEIAVSVAAEMIAVRRRAKSGWRGLSKSVFAPAEEQAGRR